jgi:endoglucanase
MRNVRARYQEAADQNIPIMIQEFGVYNYTAHDVSIAYLSDVVPIFRDFDIGFALWNLYGSFGIIDSGRDDCPYETYRGHQLDRQMLEVLD